MQRRAKIFVVICAVSCVATLSGNLPATAAGLPGSEVSACDTPDTIAAMDRKPVYLTVLDQNLPKVLELVSEQLQLKIVLLKGVTGNVTNLRIDGCARTALDAIADQVGGVWWWTGNEVRMASRSDMASRTIKTRDLDAVLAKAQRIGLSTDMLTITPVTDRGLSRISGPTALVTDFETLVEELNTQLNNVGVMRYGKRRTQRFE